MLDGMLHGTIDSPRSYAAIPQTKGSDWTKITVHVTGSLAARRNAGVRSPSASFWVAPLLGCCQPARLAFLAAQHIAALQWSACGSLSVQPPSLPWSAARLRECCQMSKDACEGTEEPAATCQLVCHGTHDNHSVVLLTLHCGGVGRSRLLLKLPQYASCCGWRLLKGLPTKLCWLHRSGRGEERFHRVGLHRMHLQAQNAVAIMPLPYILQ